MHMMVWRKEEILLVEKTADRYFYVLIAYGVIKKEIIVIARMKNSPHLMNVRVLCVLELKKSTKMSVCLPLCPSVCLSVDGSCPWTQ